jgi:hypothetical protein
MSNTVERLRRTACDYEPFTHEHAKCRCRLANSAADEIEKLQGTIIAALDCLNHDDTKGALRVLRKT